jgi:bis(5'-nucleosyl)-tetraphosphatase (symmetrical)
VGDLVNRGPDSLACLRFVRSLGDAAITVIGNHDFHLLCVADGVERKKKRDTLDELLAAPDRAELLAWLRTRPLMHVEDGFVLVHAGLLPQWTVAEARSLAAEVEAELSGPRYREFLAQLYGDEPDTWSDGLAGMDRLRVIVNAMTRLRVCDASGAMNLKFNGEPGEASDGWTPWFDLPERKSAGVPIVCGHWSALGVCTRADLLSLDSGCVWGRGLTAVRLEDRALFQVHCQGIRGPEG